MADKAIKESKIGIIITRDLLEEYGCSKDQAEDFLRINKNNKKLQIIPDKDGHPFQVVLDALSRYGFSACDFLEKNKRNGIAHKWNEKGGWIFECCYYLGVPTPPCAGWPAIRRWNDEGELIKE